MPATAPAVRPPAAASPSPVAPAGPRHARPHLELVEAPHRRRQLRTGPTVALGALLAFAIAFAVVACQVVLVQGQQRLDDVQTDIADQTDRYDQLRLQVAELEDPGRIVAAAAALGLVSPPEVVYLTPNGALTVPAGADASTPGADPLAAGGTALDEHAATRPNLEGGG